MTGDVKLVYEIMSQLKTHEERLKILKITTQRPELTLLELVMEVQYIVDQRNKKSDDR